MNWRSGLVIAAVFLLGQVPQASAMEIITTFIGGEAPHNAAGGGNLPEIFTAAAARWARSYPDSFTLRLYFGWAPIGSAGNHTLIERGGEPARELAGLILFDNSGAVTFYLDRTPWADEEYGRYTEEQQNLGAGMVNVARLYTYPTGDAVGRCDLLSVAMHEIGHALGMGVDNPGFLRESTGGSVLIGDTYPSAGTTVPLAANNSGITSHLDAVSIAYGSLMTGVCSDERRVPSALDILVNAQISGFGLFIPGRDGPRDSVVARADHEGSARGFLR